MIALLGVALLQLLGAAVVAVIDRRPFLAAVSSPTSALVALALLACASFGLPGLAVAAVMAAGVWLAPRHPTSTPPPRAFFVVLGVTAVVVLARPWAPLYWDEFVWLAKSRLGSVSFAEVTRASLDPSAGLIPAGYVPLWPASVGWLTLGHDAASAQVVAASVLLLLCLAAALESWWSTLAAARWWAVVPVFSAPLVLVHFRAVYVDLPLGLVSLALLGRLLEGRSGLVSLSFAVLLAGFKDEGVTHLLSISLVAAAVGSGGRRSLGPLLAGLTAIATWRWMVAGSGVQVIDHALNRPALDWLPTLGGSLLRHAFEVSSWGLFWPIALAAATLPGTPKARALGWVLLANLGFLVAAVLAGPERVRVFAENGTLLNRLLLQSWPVAAMLLVEQLGAAVQGSAAAPPSGRPVTEMNT